MTDKELQAAYDQLIEQMDIFSRSLKWLEDKDKQLRIAQFKATGKQALQLSRELVNLHGRWRIESEIFTKIVTRFNDL